MIRKVYWRDVSHRVAKVEPRFARIVDELDPDDTFPVYLASYPYGAMIADTVSAFLPLENKQCIRLTDPAIPKDAAEDLGYGKKRLPMGLLLEKQMEYFIDLNHEQITIPWVMSTPGAFFPFSILGNKNNRSYTPNAVLKVTAGARSSFMLPNIGCVTNHINLQRDFNIQKPAPKSLYEHWFIFKEIINSKVSQSNWNCVVLYFSERWVEKLHSDLAWLNLKNYLLELAWHRFEYDRNHQYYDIAFSLIQKKKNLKPNPYLADTARHLFAIALGAAPGYVPSTNEDALPLYELQKAFIESYGLKKYYPTIIQPKNFLFEMDEKPIYYTMQNPSTCKFSPKSRKLSSTLFELRELEHIMKFFVDELSQNSSMCADTVLNTVAQAIEFNYFHNEFDPHEIIKPSSDLPLHDDHFNFSPLCQEALFAEDAKFVRGCISMRKKI